MTEKTSKAERCKDCLGSGYVVRVDKDWIPGYAYQGGPDDWKGLKSCPSGCGRPRDKAVIRW